MKLNINNKIFGDILRQVLLFLVSIICIFLLFSQLKYTEKARTEDAIIEKVEKRITTIEGLIMTQQLQILENSIPSQHPPKIGSNFENEKSPQILPQQTPTK